MGSGILFLPGATVKWAGSGALLAWVIGSLLCASFVPLMRFLVAYSRTEDGISGIIETGIGKKTAMGFTYLVLGTVCFGMPASALIAGAFVSRFFGWGVLGTTVVGTLVILVPAFSNLRGLKTSSKLQGVASALLVGLVALILVGSWQVPTVGLPPWTQVVSSSWESVYQATVLVFWAFAGFENLAFMAKDYQNPKRDLPLSMLVAVVVCGLIYLTLSFEYVVLVPPALVDSQVGLYQLAEFGAFPKLVVPLVVILAVVSLLMNFNSWMWGVARLIQQQAQSAALPLVLGSSNSTGVPSLALKSLALVQVSVLFVLSSAPKVFDWAVSQVSLNFLVIYFLLILSAVGFAKQFLNGKARNGWRLVFSAAAITLAVLMAQSGWALLYPSIFVVLIPLLATRMRAMGESFTSTKQEGGV